jgi:hypothetical protein
LSVSFPAQNFSVSGIIKDSQNGETIIRATVFLKKSGKAAFSNQYGFYSLTAPSGNDTIVFSYVGYKTVRQPILLNVNTTINIMFTQEETTLEEVEITTKGGNENVKSTQMSSIQMDMNEIKKIPAFMGEVDILKSIQLLPGIKNAGDGNTGFYVRGGGPDQNLILLDEANIYNASHLLGFFFGV